MTDEVRLAFLGGATIYQGDRKFEITATLFAEGPQPAESFFGHYDGATAHPLYGAARHGVESGRALVRFSDGSEATRCSLLLTPTEVGSA